MTKNPKVPPTLERLIETARELGYEQPLFESDFGRVRVQLWGNENGRRNVVAHCDVRRIRAQLPSYVPVGECAQIAMRSALMEALLMGASDEALPTP